MSKMREYYMKKILITSLLFCLVAAVSCTNVKVKDKIQDETQDKDVYTAANKQEKQQDNINCEEIINKVISKYSQCKTFKCASIAVDVSYNIDPATGEKDKYVNYNPIEFIISFERPDMVRVDFTERRNGKNAIPDTTSSLYTKDEKYHLLYYKDMLVPVDKEMHYKNFDEAVSHWQNFPYSPVYFIGKLLVGQSGYFNDNRYSCKLLDSENVGKKECWKIELTSGITVWIEKNDYIIMKVKHSDALAQNTFENAGETQNKKEFFTVKENTVEYSGIVFDEEIGKEKFIFKGGETAPEYAGFIVLNQKIDEKVKIIHTNGEVMLPVKTAAKILGYSFRYDMELASAFIEKENDKIIVAVGKTGILRNGKEMELNAAAAYDNEDILVSADFFPKVFDLSVLTTSRKAVINKENFLGHSDARLYLKKGAKFQIRLKKDGKDEKKQWTYKPAEGIKKLEEQNIDITAVEKMDVWYEGEDGKSYEKAEYTETPSGSSIMWVMEAEKPGKYVLLFVERSGSPVSEDIINYNVTVTE